MADGESVEVMEVGRVASSVAFSKYMSLFAQQLLLVSFDVTLVVGSKGGGVLPPRLGPSLGVGGGEQNQDP